MRAEPDRAEPDRRLFSGHISTPRLAISEYWNNKYPAFGQQFVTKVAHDVAAQLARDATGICDLIPVSVIEEEAKAMILEKISPKPLPTLGDIIAVTAHAVDNRNGLRVENDSKWNWFARGDGNLQLPDGANSVEVPAALSITPPTCPMSNGNIAAAAVQLGIDDVKRAYALGRDSARSPMSSEALFQRIRNGGAKYAPEQLVPKLDTVGPDQGTLNWMVDSLETLWVTRIRSTRPETYGEYISKDMLPSGQMGGQLEEIKAKLDETLEPTPKLVTWLAIGTQAALTTSRLFPRQAFEKAVLQKLRQKATCLAFLLEIVHT